MVAHGSEHPLGIKGCGQPPWPARLIAHTQHDELNGVVHRNELNQLLHKSVADALEFRIALPMPNQTRFRRSNRQRRWRPEVASDFIAKINHFPCLVGNRVVAPRREPVRLTISRPCVARSDFRNGKPETRIGHNVDPRRGSLRGIASLRAGIQIDCVLASVRSKAAKTIAELQIGGRSQPVGHGRPGTDRRAKCTTEARHQ